MSCNDFKYSGVLFQLIFIIFWLLYNDCQGLQSWEDVNNVLRTEDTIIKKSPDLFSRE